MIALIFFRANNIHDGFTCISSIIGDIAAPMVSNFDHLLYAFLGIIIVFFSEYFVEYKKITVTDKNELKVYSLCSIGLLFIILSIGVFDGGQFIYFQF